MVDGFHKLWFAAWLKKSEVLIKWKKEKPHLNPLSIVLHHEYNAGVWFVQRVAIQETFARNPQLHFGDACSRATEAGRRGGRLLNIVHHDSRWEELPTGREVQREAVLLQEGDGRMKWSVSGSQLCLGTPTGDGPFWLCTDVTRTEILAESRGSKPNSSCYNCLPELFSWERSRPKRGKTQDMKAADFQKSRSDPCKNSFRKANWVLALFWIFYMPIC